MSAAAARRVAGSAAWRAAVVAETWAPSRDKARARTSTAVSGWVALGESSRWGSASAVDRYRWFSSVARVMAT